MRRLSRNVSWLVSPSGRSYSKFFVTFRLLTSDSCCFVSSSSFSFSFSRRHLSSFGNFDSGVRFLKKKRTGLKGVFASAAFSSNSRNSPSVDMSAQANILKLVEEPLVVFSKSYCPYCSASKKLLKELGYTPKVYELDLMEEGNDIQNALQQITGQRTVPNNFIGGKSVGGNSDLQALNSSGELKRLLEAAGAPKL